MTPPITAEELRLARVDREVEKRNFRKRWLAFVKAANTYAHDREADIAEALDDAGLYFMDEERDAIIASAKRYHDDRVFQPERRLERIAGRADYVLWLEGALTRVTYDQLQSWPDTHKQFVLQHDRVSIWAPRPAVKAWQLEKAWRRDHPSAYESPEFQDDRGEWAEIVEDLLREVVVVERLVLEGLTMSDVAMEWLRDAPAHGDADRATPRWYDSKHRRYVFSLDALVEFVQGAGIDTTKRKLALLLRDELRCDSVPLRDAAGVYKAMVVSGRALPRRLTA